MTKADRIRSLRDKGHTYSEIADLTDACPGYVNAALQRRNGSRPCDLRSAERQRQKRKAERRAI